MTIKEWLTPELFDINVFLVALLVNWTLFNLASNFLEDFKIPPRLQGINYGAVLLMSAAYGLLIVLGLLGVLKNQPTLYPNRYDFLLMGNRAAFACIWGGLVLGGPLGWLLGNRDKVRWTLAVLAIICEALIGMGTLLWILAQE